MKTMNSFAAQQLTKKQMNQVKGGISRGEYCKTLIMVVANNFKTMTDNELAGAQYAAKEHCDIDIRIH